MEHTAQRQVGLRWTPGEEINWLEDIEILEEAGVPDVLDHYSNSVVKVYFLNYHAPALEGRERPAGL